MNINSIKKITERIFSLILLSSSICLSSEDHINNPLLSLFSNLTSISSISSQKTSSDYKLSWSYIPPSVEIAPNEILNFFSDMFADVEDVKRNFSSTYLESLKQRVGQNMADLPKMFLKDAQSRGLHYIFIKDQKINIYFGYFSFRSYNFQTLEQDSPLYANFEKLSLENKTMWNVGTFFLKDYRQKGILSTICNKFINILNKECDNLEGMTFCSDKDHPVIHTFITHHPEWKWRCCNEKPFNDKYYYIYQINS